MQQNLKLHLGCGKRDFPGFTNVDLADFPHIDFKTSVDDLSMIEDGCADLVYASHVLEYFDRETAESIVLPEWRRVLSDGGTLRIAVPDFERICWLYYETDIGHCLGMLYGKMPMGDQTIYHKTAYDFQSLKDMLERVGFKNVRQYDWKLTEHGEYDDHSQAYYPHMDKEDGILMSLNVECEK